MSLFRFYPTYHAGSQISTFPRVDQGYGCLQLSLTRLQKVERAAKRTQAWCALTRSLPSRIRPQPHFIFWHQP
eukprot:2273935-Rhodomonas_salina.11